MISTTMPNGPPNLFGLLPNKIGKPLKTQEKSNSYWVKLL
jgi:hypothetical protein